MCVCVIVCVCVCVCVCRVCKECVCRRFRVFAQRSQQLHQGLVECKGKRTNSV